MKKHKIEIRSDVIAAGKILDMALVRRSVRTALDCEGVDRPCSVSVRITRDEGIREINRAFRQIDRPTDVLSFPLQSLTPGRFEPDMSGLDRDTGLLPLGDIILSLDRVMAQAREYGHSAGTEAVYLIVHSVLHLLGYDHTDEGADKALMRSREESILYCVGIRR